MALRARSAITATSAALDRLEQPGCWPGVTNAAEPDAAVGPVEQSASRRSEPKTFKTGRGPSSVTARNAGDPLAVAQRPPLLADRQPARPECVGHARGAHPAVRHPEDDQQAGPDGHPAATASTSSTGSSPPATTGGADQQQRGPGRPRQAAQPRRGGHRDGGQPREHGRIGEACPGQPGMPPQAIGNAPRAPCPVR